MNNPSEFPDMTHFSSRNHRDIKRFKDHPEVEFTLQSKANPIEVATHQLYPNLPGAYRRPQPTEDEVKRASGDFIDLKLYEPAMRFLIDTYIRAEESEKISAFDDLPLIQFIVERGPDVVDALPKGMRKNEQAVAETIENNVRKLIINESPVDPAYYEKMSKLLDALIAQRRKGAIDYKQYLATIAELTKQAVNPGGGSGYPSAMSTPARRALYNNLDRDEALVLAVDQAATGQIRRATAPVAARNGERREPLFPRPALPPAGDPPRRSGPHRPARQHGH